LKREGRERKKLKDKKGERLGTIGKGGHARRNGTRKKSVIRKSERTIFPRVRKDGGESKGTMCGR